MDQKGEQAQYVIREARGAERKRLRALALARIVGPDLMRRAERELEKVNEKGVGEVNGVMEGGKRALRD